MYLGWSQCLTTGIQDQPTFLGFMQGVALSESPKGASHAVLGTSHAFTYPLENDNLYAPDRMTILGLRR